MTKKIHYLFLTSLLGTFSMAGSASSIDNEQPKDTTIEVVENVQVPPSKEMSSVQTPLSWWQDIKNHPFVWAAAVCVAEFCLVLIAIAIIIQDIFDSPNFWGGLFYAFSTFVGSSVIFGVLSLLSTSWKSRWRSESKKEEGFVIPSFSVRFWRSFRFMLIPSVVSMVLKIPFFFGFIKKIKPLAKVLYGKDLEFYRFAGLPLILCLLGYVGIFAYGYFRQGKNKEKKDLAATS